MAAHQRIMHMHASRGDVAASRQFFDESLRLRAIAEDVKSVSYDAGDVVLVLDWALDHTTPPGEHDPRSDVVLLVDEIGAVRAALESHGVRCTETEASVSFAVPEGLTFVMLEFSDECLMWPSVGWRAGPSSVVRTRPRSTRS